MTEQAIERDGMSIPRRYWAYGAIITTLVLAVMDASVANVALPTIAGDFHATPSQSIAIVSLYQLAIVMLLLPLAALGDIYGYRRVYSTGVAVFTVASFCCACAWSLDLLTAARILQGIGAAGIMSVNTALIRYIFPTAKLGQALGLNTLAVGISSSIGPSFAGIMLAIVSWHWLFAINVPLGIIAYVLGAKTLPDSRRAPQKFDIISALLAAVMFGMLLTSIDSLSRGGAWPRSVAEVAIGLAAALWCIRRQAHRPAPLLPIDLLKIPVFALSMGTSVCSFCAQMLAFVSLPFMLQTSLGFSPTAVGFLIVPWPLAVAVCAPIAGRLSDRFSSALLGFVGLLLLVVGLLFLAFVPAHAGAANIAWRMALCGAGFGTFQAPNNRTIVTSAPRIRSGAASGMLGTARLLGQALGAASVALILAHVAGAQGARISLLTGAAFAFVAAFVSVARYGKSK
ncbi:MFS transporter [Acidocella sp.]|uniref:MFS transporter n=1 Tax=Acidocella sp. TaxID=50710 RepID=UPI002F3E5A4F